MSILAILALCAAIPMALAAISFLRHNPDEGEDWNNFLLDMEDKIAGLGIWIVGNFQHIWNWLTTDPNAAANAAQLAVEQAQIDAHEAALAAASISDRPRILREHEKLLARRHKRAQRKNMLGISLGVVFIAVTLFIIPISIAFYSMKAQVTSETFSGSVGMAPLFAIVNPITGGRMPVTIVEIIAFMFTMLEPLNGLGMALGWDGMEANDDEDDTSSRGMSALFYMTCFFALVFLGLEAMFGYFRAQIEAPGDTLMTAFFMIQGPAASGLMMAMTFLWKMGFSRLSWIGYVWRGLIALFGMIVNAAFGLAYLPFYLLFLVVIIAAQGIGMGGQSLVTWMNERNSVNDIHYEEIKEEPAEKPEVINAEVIDDEDDPDNGSDDVIDAEFEEAVPPGTDLTVPTPNGREA